MKRRCAWFGLGAVMAAGVSAIAVADQTTPVRGLHEKNPSFIALTNATVITEPGKSLEQATLVIKDGIIQAVNSSNRAPEGARVIDATGYTIYPGFIDPYSNYAVEQPAAAASRSRGQRPQYSNAREGGNGSNSAIHAQRNWVETVKVQPRDAKGYTDLGFTAVQTARLDGIFRGRAATVSLADKLPNDVIYQAYARHFGSFDKGSSKQQYPSSLMGSIALIRQTLSDAAWYKEAQGKHTMQGAVEFNAALAALGDIQNEGVVFEVSNEHSLLRATQVFSEFSVPLKVVGSGFEYARLDEVKKSGAELIVPLNFPAAPAMQGQFSELDVSLADLRHWERAPGNPAALANAGVRFAFTSHGLESSSDFWPNIRKAIAHGLAPTQALAALTTIPADMAGVADQVGRIQAGYRADFVVSQGDLFADGEIVSVWLQGEEKRLQEMHPASFAGEYSLTLAGQDLTLNVADTSRLQGSLEQGDTKIKLQGMRTDDSVLYFHGELSAVGLPGVHRFRLQPDSLTTYSGRAQNAASELIEFTALRAEQAEEQTPMKAEAGTPEYVSQLTWPNVGFGVDAQPEQINLHIRHATVWTADDQGILTDTDIIVRNGLIHRIGKNLSTPRGYQVLDAAGMHITPGFLDEHSHIAISQGVNEGTEPVTAEVRIGDVVNPDDIHIYRSLAGGTTVAHLLHGSANPIGGQGQAIKLRWGQDAEGLKFKEVPWTIKMALGENVKQSNWGDMNTIRYPQTRMGVAALIRDYFQSAREYGQAQEAYTALSRSERRRTAPPRKDYRMQTLLEILQGQRHTHVHSYVASEVVALMDVVEELGFRIHTFTHILEGYKVADELRAHGANASTFADWWAFKFEAYDAVPQNACQLMEKGLVTSINSDSNDLQRRLNTEAAKSVRYCGMSEYEALKMITLYPAQQLEVEEHVGSITVGKHADFVLWNAPPLSAYAKVQQTWIEGRKYFDRADDLARRSEIANERQQLIEKVLSQGSEAHRGNSNGYRTAQPAWQCEDNHDIWRWTEFAEMEGAH